MMESIQLSQLLADLSNLGAAEPEAAAAIVKANLPVIQAEAAAQSTPSNADQQQQQQPPAVLRRAWSSETNAQPKFDMMGRRFFNSPKSASAANSTPGTPRHTELEEDLERATTIMALYDIRAKLKQQDNSSLIKAREKINALAARQQAQQAAERNIKAAEEIRRQRYSFPKS